MNTDMVSVLDITLQELKKCPLKESYSDEQHDLQYYLCEVIKTALQAHSLNRYHVIPSIGESSPKPSIKALGTSFWPDLAIHKGNSCIIAIEVKYIREDQSASKALAETIGQSIIYTLRYEHVIAFVLHRGKRGRSLEEYTESLRNVLVRNRVELVLRRPQGSSRTCR